MKNFRDFNKNDLKRIVDALENNFHYFKDTLDLVLAVRIREYMLDENITNDYHLNEEIYVYNNIIYLDKDDIDIDEEYDYNDSPTQEMEEQRFNEVVETYHISDLFRLIEEYEYRLYKE